MKRFSFIMLALIACLSSHLPARADIDALELATLAEIDLRLKYPSLFSQSTIRDQGQYGICYAAAAATLIDFHRGVRGLDGRNHSIPISAIEASMQSTFDQNDQGIDGGEVCDVIRSLSNRTYACAHQAISQASFKDLGFTVQTALVTKVMMPYIGTGKIMPVLPYEFIESTKSKKLSTDQRDFITAMRGLLKWVKKELRERRGILEEKLPSPSEIYTLFQATQQWNLYARFPTAFELLVTKKYCMNDRLVMPYLRCSTTQGNPQTLQSVLDRKLLIDQTPVGLDLCSEVLNQPSFFGATNGVRSQNCSPHAVVIIGKRSARNGKSQYLIRNSWSRFLSSNTWPIDQGDLWIAEDALLKNTLQINVVY